MIEKHRLHLRGAGVGGGLELVDPQVGGAEQSHVAVGMGDGRGPSDDRGAVMTLNRVKQPPLAVRAAGDADVDQHVDLAAADQGGALAREL